MSGLGRGGLPTDYDDTDGVEIRVKRGEDGQLRAAFVPRGVRKLRGEAFELASELQHVVGHLVELESRQALLVERLREEGVSWAVIGWCIGTTGEAARQRFGVDL